MKIDKLRVKKERKAEGEMRKKEVMKLNRRTHTRERERERQREREREGDDNK